MFAKDCMLNIYYILYLFYKINIYQELIFI